MSFVKAKAITSFTKLLANYFVFRGLWKCGCLGSSIKTMFVTESRFHLAEIFHHWRRSWRRRWPDVLFLQRRPLDRTLLQTKQPQKEGEAVVGWVGVGGRVRGFQAEAGKDGKEDGQHDIQVSKFSLSTINGIRGVVGG
jgi:hypothetical protein